MKVTQRNRNISVIKPHECTSIFLELIDILGPMTWPQMQLLACDADITAQTLWNWIYGPTCNPRVATVVKVANAIGYELTLRKTGNKPMLRRVK